MSEVPSQIAQEPSTRGKVHEDLVNEMWPEYLENVDDYDKRLTGGWRDDANGVVVFTALFSTIVAAFIIESYKQLSLNDSGSKTAFFVEQISNQFADFANGAYVQPQKYNPPSPSASIICVNILWLLSFLLSTTSALFATLMLQWARIYIDLPQIPSAPEERARVRSVLFFGMEKYRMRLAVETAPTLLHLSVFLFFIGLVVFFFTIFKTVAIVVLIAVGLFGLAYFALTILPCFDRSCPYRTPMSSLWWYIWHTSLFFVTLFFCWFLKLLHCCLVPYNMGTVTSFTQRILTQCFRTFEDLSEKHGKRLKHGFGTAAVEYAREASQDVDVEALTWLFQLPALTEKSKIQKFVASLPGETIIQLLSKSFQDGKVSFRHHLSTLLRSCTPGPDTAPSGLNEDMRRRRLSICLNAVQNIAKASAASPYSPLFNDMRIRFANIALMRPLWADGDPAIRVTARSICALFARQLLHQPEHQPERPLLRPLEERELAWLQEVLNKPSNTIFREYNDLDRATAVDNMIVDAFVDGVLSYQTDVMPSKPAISFKDTLMVLKDTNSRASGVHTDTFEKWLSDHIERIEQENDREDRDNVVGQLRMMLPSTTGTNTPQALPPPAPQPSASGT